MKIDLRFGQCLVIQLISPADFIRIRHQSEESERIKEEERENTNDIICIVDGPVGGRIVCALTRPATK